MVSDQVLFCTKTLLIEQVLTNVRKIIRFEYGFSCLKDLSLQLPVDFNLFLLKLRYLAKSMFNSVV